jgi:alpha/beta superfamily hydrolase
MPTGVPLAMIGYSFGAWVGAQAADRSADVRQVIAIAPPLRVFGWDFAPGLTPSLTVIVGDRDGFCPRDRLEALLASTRAQHVVLAGADHLLAGRDDELTAAVRDHLGTGR